MKKFRMIKDGKVIGYTRLVQSEDPQSQRYVDYQYALIAEDYPDDELVWETYGNHVSHRPECDRLDQSTGRRDKKRTEKYPEGQEVFGGDTVKFSNHSFRAIVKYYPEHSAYLFDSLDPHATQNNPCAKMCWSDSGLEIIDTPEKPKSTLTNRPDLPSIQKDIGAPDDGVLK